MSISVISKTFGSCEEFAEALHTKMNYNNELLGHRSTATDEDTVVFTGSSSYEEADRMLLSGYAQGAQLLQEETVRIQNTHYKTVCIRGVAGAVPIVPAYLSGNPRCMLSSRNLKSPMSVITLYCNIAVWGTTPCEQIITASAKILTAIKMIELSNIRIELYATQLAVFYGSGAKGDVYVDVSVLLKKRENPLNVLRAAYPLVHPSFNRRHMFRFYESLPKEELKNKNPRYGCPCLSSQYAYKKRGVYVDLLEVIRFDLSVQDIVNIILKQK